MRGKALRTCGWLLPTIAAIGLAGCASTPEEDPVLQGKLSDLDSRTTNIERVVQNQSLLTLAQRADQLQNEVSVLRGRIEVLENANEQLRKQQRDLYADLDRRISALETALKAGTLAGPAGGAALGPGPGAAAGTGSADQAAYNHAFEALKAADYSAAIAQFRDFLRVYAHSTLADNAQYWLGEAYYVTRDYDDAIGAFAAVGEKYPQSRKAPDALLKVGYAQYELKHLADARATLNQVVQRYPASDAAKLATERLAHIPADAH
jgi:tol-pal system protein YbgF